MCARSSVGATEGGADDDGKLARSRKSQLAATVVRARDDEREAIWRHCDGRRSRSAQLVAVRWRFASIHARAFLLDQHFVEQKRCKPIKHVAFFCSLRIIEINARFRQKIIQPTASGFDVCRRRCCHRGQTPPPPPS